MATYSSQYVGLNNLGEFTTFKPDDVIRFSITAGGQTSLTRTNTTAGSALQPMYRGTVLGQYVYNLGSPPLGAVNIAIIGYQ